MGLAQAKNLRRRMTDAERRLWYLLRAHRFAGAKFKRQVPLGNYVVDFVCFDRKLVIEADGGQHADNRTDKRRDDWLKSQGFRVLRFWNNDVLTNTSGVLEMISTALGDFDEETPSPGSLRSPPSPTRGEGKRSLRQDS